LARLLAAPLSVPMPKDTQLLKIAQALHTDPGNTRTLDERGQQVGAPRRTLSRRFRKDTGLSFVEWRQALRLLASLPCWRRGVRRHCCRTVGLCVGIRIHRRVSGALSVLHRAPSPVRATLSIWPYSGRTKLRHSLKRTHHNSSRRRPSSPKYVPLNLPPWRDQTHSVKRIDDPPARSRDARTVHS